MTFRNAIFGVVLLQGFHWETPVDPPLWTELRREAPALARAGFTAIWVPPAGKGVGGKRDVGYGVYDPWDLGEFNQKGTTRTKYGTRAELQALIRAAHAAGLEVHADAVMNHLAGAEATEPVRAIRVDPDDRRRELGSALTLRARTVFDFPGRGGRYSTFRWRAEHFDGTDWAENLPGERSIFKFAGHAWEADVDPERGNFDFLMFSDTDTEHPAVAREYADWGRWLLRDVGFDGLRIDAAKHISSGFVAEWVEGLRRATRKARFAVAEYFSPDAARLRAYVAATRGRVAVFDFSLRQRFEDAARARGAFDLRGLARDTLAATHPAHAVTFVDNHDTQRRPRPLATPVEPWFKPLAYAFILLRREGTPCVFAADYFGHRGTGGAPLSFAPLRAGIDLLLEARRRTGEDAAQRDFFDDPDLVAWVRAPSATARAAGARTVAVLLSDSLGSGTLDRSLDVGAVPTAGPRTFHEITGQVAGIVTVGPDGHGRFKVRRADPAVPGRSLAVWVEER